MRDQVEPPQSQRVDEAIESSYFVFICRGRVGRIGAPEARPVDGDDAVPLGQRRNLVTPARCALGIAMQKQHRFPVAGFDAKNAHQRAAFVDVSATVGKRSFG
ncbi:hypothetical protein MAHJHV61_16840 [Mycobacterium avium subsp. hominissuis]